jgi:hypothetical protein
MGGQTRGKLMGACVQFVANALRTCACLHKNQRIPFTDDTFASGSKRWDAACLVKLAHLVPVLLMYTCYNLKRISYFISSSVYTQGSF